MVADTTPPAASQRPALDLRTELLIGGRSVAGEGPPLAVEDPATEQIVATINEASVAQLDASVAAARDVLASGWARDRALRSGVLYRLADLIERDATRIARAIVAETGAPLAATERFQVGGAARYFRWYAEAALVDRARYFPPTAPSASMVRLVPVGVVAAITAYNYPLLLAANKVGAATAAGCPVVLAPSPRAPLATLILGELAEEAGFPAGALNVIVGGPDLYRRLTEHPGVDKVSFTGSTRVGELVRDQATAAGSTVVLELGGKAGCILLDDCDLPAVVPGLLVRLFRHAGQGCQVPARIIVPRSRLEEFCELASAAAERIVVGDPWDARSEVGPVISAEHRDFVNGMVERAVDQGASVVASAPLPADVSVGHWVRPVLLAGVAPDAEIAMEEVFGPVGVVLPYDDLDGAVELANGTDYGLAAHVYGADTATCIAVAERLLAGSVHINGVGLRPDAPSGGFKRSGIGREQGEEGIREFLATQTISWAL